MCPFLIVFASEISCLDYCDIFLTHDAPRVRKDHNSGWKHALQVKAYYQGRYLHLQNIF